MLVGLIAAPPVTAQEYRLPLEWHWYVNASGGIILGNGATFEAIDAALRAGGWATRAAQCAGLSTCQAPLHYAEDQQIPLTIAVRRAFGERGQVRLMGSLVKPGSYAGTRGNYRVTVTPAVTVLAAQAVLAVGPAWIAAGPSVNLTRNTSGSAAAPVTTTATTPGLAFGAGVTFPPHRPLFLEAAIERRIVGALDVPLVPVPGAPDIPAMQIPLSHTVITLGVGWRLP